jgi:hypothetical protein
MISARYRYLPPFLAAIMCRGFVVFISVRPAPVVDIRIPMIGWVTRNMN